MKMIDVYSIYSNLDIYIYIYITVNGNCHRVKRCLGPDDAPSEEAFLVSYDVCWLILILPLVNYIYLLITN
jgi:hypothetical protein